MPIHCPLNIERLSTEQFGSLDYAVMGQMFASQNDNQRFHLSDNDTAFELTAFAKLDNNYTEQLQRLLNLSPLQCLHWINIGPHCITFRTVERT